MVPDQAEWDRSDASGQRRTRATETRTETLPSAGARDAGGDDLFGVNAVRDGTDTAHVVNMQVARSVLASTTSRRARRLCCLSDASPWMFGEPVTIRRPSPGHRRPNRTLHARPRTGGAAADLAANPPSSRMRARPLMTLSRQISTRVGPQRAGLGPNRAPLGRLRASTEA